MTIYSDLTTPVFLFSTIKKYITPIYIEKETALY